jgi:hypothetical protein
MNSFFSVAARKILLSLAALTLIMVCTIAVLAADTGKIVVQVDKPGAKIDPMFYGIMTEEINFSYEGGLYGELIRNRIFRNPQGDGSAVVVTGTKEPGLFTSEHYSMSAFSCKISRSSTLRRRIQVLPAPASAFFPSMSRGMNSRTLTFGPRPVVLTAPTSKLCLWK